MTYAKPYDKIQFCTAFIQQAGLHFRIAHSFTLSGFDFFQFQQIFINGTDFAAYRLNIQPFLLKILGTKMSFIG